MHRTHEFPWRLWQRRGPYAKGKAKRAEILDVALEVIAREGYTGATVKELADAVGLSQNGLLHYFGSKDALFAEILRRRDEIAAIEVDFESGTSMTDSSSGSSGRSTWRLRPRAWTAVAARDGRGDGT